MSILGIMGLFLGSIVVLILGAAFGSAKMIDMLIGEKHRAIEAILNDGAVPEKWRKGYDKLIAKLSQEPESAHKVENTRAKALKSYLKKVDGLIKYMVETRLVETEKDRKIALQKLRSARERWVAGDLDAQPPEPEAAPENPSEADSSAPGSAPA